MKHRIVAIAGLSLIVFSACSGGAQNDATPTAAPVETRFVGQEDGPTLLIASPDPGSTVESAKVSVETKVTGIDIVDKFGRPNEDGEGHLIYYANNGFQPTYEVPTTKGRPANSGGTGYIAAVSAATEYDWSRWNLKGGDQVLAVQIVNNDNTPLDPPLVARVTITVKASPTPSGTPVGGESSQPTPA